MQRILISVIIPVYNVEKYLHECINSIIGQTYHNLEIILIDDGSTDSSGVICDEYEKQDSRIIVLHKKNGGLSDARNAGLDNCRGEYIAFVDSDDYISPYFIEIMLYNIIDFQADMVTLAEWVDFWDGDIILPDLALHNRDYKAQVINSEIVLQMMFYQRIATGAPFIFCKKDIFKEIRFPYGYLYEDLATTYKAFIKANKVVLLRSKLYVYRHRKDSIVQRSFSKEKLICLTIANELYKDVCIYNIKLKKAVITRIFSTIFSVFLQVPEDNEAVQRLLWDKIKIYRWSILCDRSTLMRRKDRVAAILSFLGMRFVWKLGRKFGQKGSMYK